jgi:hypothetical protein
MTKQLDSPAKRGPIHQPNALPELIEPKTDWRQLMRLGMNERSLSFRLKATNADCKSFLNNSINSWSNRRGQLRVSTTVSAFTERRSIRLEKGEQLRLVDRRNLQSERFGIEQTLSL